MHLKYSIVPYFTSNTYLVCWYHETFRVPNNFEAVSKPISIKRLVTLNLLNYRGRHPVVKLGNFCLCVLLQNNTK